MTLGIVGMIVTMALIVLNGEGSAFSDNWFYLFVFALCLLLTIIHEQVMRARLQLLTETVETLTKRKKDKTNEMEEH